MIGAVTFNRFPFERHLVSRTKKTNSRKRMLVVGLTLTSMVDMFSLLVIFLLQTFSTSPELLVVSPGVVLPTAGTGVEIKDAPVLSVGLDGIYLDQKKVGSTDEVLKDPTVLMEKLESLRELWQKMHPTQNFSGQITVQAHKDIPSTLISQIMGLLPGQNYGSIQLAVISGGGGT